MIEARFDRAGLQVSTPLVRFLEEDVLPGTGIDVGAFWTGVASLIARFTPRNRTLLAERDELQSRIDAWHLGRAGTPIDLDAYVGFLRSIGYLVDDPEPFAIAPTGVDREIAALAGPQLVVPVLNARFLLNAVNARWGSLYDALYGTDAIASLPAPAAYDFERGKQVIAWAKRFLDDTIPLAAGSHADVQAYRVQDGELFPLLADPTLLVGYVGSREAPAGLLFQHNGLHIEIVIDRAAEVGTTDAAGVADVILEAALTTIVDFEDSVAAVDAADKVAAYANWLGLMRGDLSATFSKNGRSLTRTLAADRNYLSPAGHSFTLPGRSLLLVRNVGHLMTSPAMMLPDGSEVFEGLLDAVVTSLIALHDVTDHVRQRNSRTRSIYIVKPKMHGPEEVAFSNDLFDAVEDLLGLSRHTIKIGVMDEERRTSANLAACIAAVKERIVFINTGFLDRTGDEIHTSMRAGSVVPKGEIRNAPWISAYEDRNVQIGLSCGFEGRAQIGKGMWAAPDRMADMLAQKIAHPLAGATTAWVPSPTAATLHATHYHRVDVHERLAQRRSEDVSPLKTLLTPPLAMGRNWDPDEVERELDNNAQGILGYVVRWIHQGIGCSKVPDINDVGLMEDRATLRISAQHMANWLHHGVATEEQVKSAFRRMARRVDEQNSTDPAYRKLLGEDGESLAYSAALALVFEGFSQPNGYTEPLLIKYRGQHKLFSKSAHNDEVASS